MSKKPKFNLADEVHRGNVAEKVLADALKQVTTKHKEHGDTSNSFAMIAEFWSTYVKHAAVVQGFTGVEAHDVTQMMVLLKVARSVYGKSADNHIDAAGYTALSALLEPEAGKE